MLPTRTVTAQKPRTLEVASPIIAEGHKAIIVEFGGHEGFKVGRFDSVDHGCLTDHVHFESPTVTFVPVLAGAEEGAILKVAPNGERKVEAKERVDMGILFGWKAVLAGHRGAVISDMIGKSF